MLLVEYLDKLPDDLLKAVDQANAPGKRTKAHESQRR